MNQPLAVNSLNMKEINHKSTSEYIRNHGVRISPIKQMLIDETKKLGSDSEMQIIPTQGELFTMIIKIMKAKKGIEFGTFTGYSSLCFMEGLPENGKLITCDISETWASIARKYWKLANVDHKADLRIGNGLDIIKMLLNDPNEVGTFDFAFIDADKQNYTNYYQGALELLRPGGIILVDNTLWDGQVYNPKIIDESTVAIRNLNDLIHKDTRVDMVLLEFADGLTIAMKK